MHFFTNVNPISRKKNPTVENTTILKYSLTLVLTLGILSFFAWIYAQNNQSIRELRKELAALEAQRADLSKSLQNCGSTLEHLKEGSYITRQAKPLGLRPPDPRQRVIQFQVVRTEKGLQATPRIVGSKK